MRHLLITKAVTTELVITEVRLCFKQRRGKSSITRKFQVN